MRDVRNYCLIAASCEVARGWKLLSKELSNQFLGQPDGISGEE